MKEQQHIALLDNIINAMHTLPSNNKANIARLLETITPWITTIGSRSCANETNPEILDRIINIWQRTSARFQGQGTKHGKKLAFLPTPVRKLLIKHEFYLDFELKNDKSIFFILFDLVTPAILPLTIQKLHDLKCLNRVSSYTNNRNENIFEYIERIVAQRIDRGNSRSHRSLLSANKINQYISFAKSLKENLHSHEIACVLPTRLAQFINNYPYTHASLAILIPKLPLYKRGKPRKVRPEDSEVIEEPPIKHKKTVHLDLPVATTADPIDPIDQDIGTFQLESEVDNSSIRLSPNALQEIDTKAITPYFAHVYVRTTPEDKTPQRHTPIIPYTP